MAELFSGVFIKVLSAFSALLMLFMSPGGQIKRATITDECPAYYNYENAPEATKDNYYQGEYVAKNLGDVELKQNPFLAQEGTNGMHANSYQTDAYSFNGPLGNDPSVISRSMNVFGGLVATLAFDSQGRIMCVSGNVVGFRLLLLDAETLEILCETRLPQRASTIEFFKTFDFDVITTDTSGGAYFHLLDGDRPLIGNSENIVQIFSIDESSGTPEWKIDEEYDLSSYFADGSYMTDVCPDYEGNLWFASRLGEVGYIDVDTKEVKLVDLDKGEIFAGSKLEIDEEIQNSFAIAPEGVYVVSDQAMYRFEKSELGEPMAMWRTEYDRGTTLKPGAINQGSGTTPTCLDIPKSNGEICQTVAITDNADGRVNIVVYDRTTGEIIDQKPLFEDGHSVSENSIVAFDRSFIVENNYTDSGSSFLENDPKSEPGVWKYSMNADCTELELSWICNEASSTVVPKMSTTNGLLYLYTREINEDVPDRAVAWYFTAVDFETGKTVYKVLTGTGKNWNNSYGPITIGPNDRAYVGVFNGVISIKDDVK